MKLEKRQVEEIIPSIKRYVAEEFGEEIGNLKAELLLDYFIKEIAPYAYNRSAGCRGFFEGETGRSPWKLS